MELSRNDDRVTESDPRITLNRGEVMFNESGK